VFSGDAVGPDLSTIPLQDRFIWVWAHSVFSKTPVLRQAKTSELMAIWDYEGKLESRGWSREQSLLVLSARLLSPPGKMLRQFLQSVSKAILLKLCQVDCQTPDEESRGGSRGFIGDIPFSHLEVNATTRVAAAQANDAEVDLSAWSSPSETEEEAHARVILRRSRFAGGRTTFVGRPCGGGIGIDVIHMIGQQLKTVFSEPVSALTGTGIGGLTSSFGGFRRNFRDR